MVQILMYIVTLCSTLNSVEDDIEIPITSIIYIKIANQLLRRLTNFIEKSKRVSREVKIEKKNQEGVNEPIEYTEAKNPSHL